MNLKNICHGGRLPNLTEHPYLYRTTYAVAWVISFNLLKFNVYYANIPESGMVWEKG